ncbi:MAG: hypothetical protein A2X61_04655 [Ignavibacteria bacterium GWB2_35_12]|nr:MAG: hypothetical protein A2X61_04655 [Ignavibacteria bacterium GWB2_35_12]OGU87171.1 MAG: hypothetical protein A2220_07805 [Ignavibacteria bacterium RIFOXYA2_FULL_35_10]OGV24595.1 MAG: hypothetical protein A2475_09245 [Ignavibacteria bacterium RIFOXYC2_FULL_35_21]
MKKFNNYFGAFFAAALMLLLTGSFASYAIDAPNPPQNLTAELDSTGKEIAVKLSWERDTTGTQPNYFFIYMAPKDSDDPNDFSYIAKVQNQHNQHNFHFLVHHLDNGHYSFYVTAVLYHENQKLESSPSNIVKIEMVQRPYVHVKPAETLRGIMGLTFTFTVKAESNVDCPILFELVDGPDGMTIDQSLGLVTWIPLANGKFSFKVKAWLECDASVTGYGEFKIQVGNDDNHKPFVHIVSKPNERGMPGEPYIYEVKAESNINCPILFELLPEHPDGMEINSQTGVITWTPGSIGYYHVGVRVFLECQPDVYAKQVFTIRVGDDSNFAFIKITSKPNLHAKPNSEYEYEVEAESNIDCNIIYELLEGPDGMTMDSTGKVTWHTPANGTFPVAVKATLECRLDISFTQRFTIKVGEGDDKPFCALIQGPATFENGDSVKEGVVKAVKLDSNSKEHPLYVGQIKNGEFSVRVNEGTYILKFSGPHFKEEWYENASSMDSATRVPVVCGDTITLNVVLDKLPEPKHFTVTGKVVAESDSTGIYANVEFIPVEKMHGREGNEDSKNAFHTKTDGQGNYEISLPNTFSYIAHAIHMSDDRKYAGQYYDQVSDPLEADIIVLTGDLSGIDFYLKAIEEKNNGFSGVVVDDFGVGIRARVIAHLVSSNEHNKRFNKTVETDEQGNFTFSNMLVGKYVLLSIPYEKTLVPGYYKLNDFVVHKWRDATRIEVGDSIGASIVIKHNVRTGILGVAHVNGNITSGTLSIGKSGDETQSGEPVAGAFVYVLDENGDVSDYIFSDNSGNFELSELGVGTYTLVADKVGYLTYEQEVTTDYETKSNVSLDFSMTEQPTDVTDETINVNDAVIYPSPVESKATIKFNSSEGTGKLLLYGSNGMQLEVRSVQTVEGENQIELNMSNLPTGAYFVRIITHNRIITVPVRVVR